MHALNAYQSIELSGDELAAIRGGQLANFANSPGELAGILGIGPGIGPGFMSGGVNTGLFYQNLCGVCGPAPGIFAIGGLGGGPFTTAFNNQNNNIPGGNIFRNNFYTIIN